MYRNLAAGCLPDDIAAEVKRGRKLHCTYCKRIGATIGMLDLFLNAPRSITEFKTSIANISEITSAVLIKIIQLHKQTWPLIMLNDEQ